MIIPSEDSGLSTQIELGDTDSEYVTLNKIKRIHSFLSHQDKPNNFSYVTIFNEYYYNMRVSSFLVVWQWQYRISRAWTFSKYEFL